MPTRRRAALRLEAAEDVDRLGRQPDVRHHGNAALDEIVDGFRHAPPALEFDGAAVGLLHHLRGVAEGDGGALLVGAERHVDDDEGALGAAHDGAAVHDHQFERHRHRRFIAVHHHAEAVADEQEIAVFVGNRRRVRVIGGQRDDGLPALPGGDVGRHQAPALESEWTLRSNRSRKAPPDMAPTRPRRGRAELE